MRALRRRGRDALLLVAIFAVLFVFVFPFLWVVVTSLRTEATLFTSTLALFPEPPSFAAYRALLTDSAFPRYILNSILVSLPASIVTVALGLLAAYAFSRRSFRGKDALFVTVIFSQLFPFVVLVTPLYVVFFQTGLINSYFGLAAIYVAVTLPFSIYMLVGYLAGVPKALDEAAILDGCTTLQVITLVVLPVAWPGVAATAIYAFAQAWNEYVFALAFMTQDHLKTVPVGLAGFFGEYSTRWDMVMSASVIATIPTLLFFLLAQRQLVAGLTAGSVKQ